MIQDKNGAEIRVGSVLVGDHFGETFVVSHLESRVIRGVYRFGLREYEDARIDALHLLARPDNCWTALGNISVIEDFLRALTRHAKGRIAVEPKTDSVFRDSDFAPDPDRIMREKIAKEENAADDEMSLRGAYRRFDRVVRHVLAEEAPHAAIVTDFCSNGAVVRQLVAWVDLGGEKLTYGVRVDDPAHSTDSVFRAVIHEALRKIGARQMGAKK